MDESGLMEARPAQDDADCVAPEPTRRSRLRRWAPLILLALAAAGAFFVFRDALSLEALRDNRADLIAWRDQNYLRAAAAFMGGYALAVALSAPGAFWMTLAGGFLFGLWPGAPMIIVAATAGAMVIFWIARGSLGAALRERAGPWMRRVQKGFEEDAASWLLILRLTPVAPFFIVNILPALFGVKTRVFFWTTLIGIAPATAVYAWVGASLGEALASDELAAGDVAGVIFEPRFLAPLLGLALLAAAPIAIKRLRRRKQAES